MTVLKKVTRSSTKTEPSFHDLLNKSIRSTRAKAFKVANRYEDIEEAKKEVLKILNDQRNLEGYIREYKENFIISIDGVKYTITNDFHYLDEKYAKIHPNHELKILHLNCVTAYSKSRQISVAELISKYNKREVRFLEYENTKWGDIYTEIFLKKI